MQMFVEAEIQWIVAKVAKNASMMHVVQAIKFVAIVMTNAVARVKSATKGVVFAIRMHQYQIG